MHVHPVAYVLIFVSTIALGEWTPPTNPDPSKILQEAEADARNHHYEDALAKQVWFHENALKYQPSQFGVRLSFALGSWQSLAAHYPPALKKLQSIRDETEKRVRSDEGGFQDFMDVLSINKTLQMDGKTAELFLWMDSKKPALARMCFDVATPSLLEAKEYKLCGKYIDPDRQLQSEIHTYRLNLNLGKEAKYGVGMKEYAESSFSDNTATLVALLVLNERKDEAERIAAAALKEWDDAGFTAQMEKAKEGVPPKPRY